jgi:DNA-directed RNA polymerase specialized sigma24 family protein
MAHFQRRLYEKTYGERARERRRIEAASRQQRVSAASRKRFLWGYISLVAKHGNRQCEGCKCEIEVGDPCWWHPIIRSMRCWDCKPTWQTFDDNEIVVWYVKEGQYEEQAGEDEDDEGERVLGVAWVAGEEPGYEPLDEVSDEAAQPSQPHGWSEHDEAGEGTERDNFSFSSSLREDVPNARKLTSRDELLARPFESVFEDVKGKLEYHVRWAFRKSAGHFDRDDLQGEVYLKLVESMKSFTGAGNFGGYLDVVIPNALVDYARRELPHDQGTVPLDEEAQQETFRLDPTEDWINGMEIRQALTDTPGADLLVLGANGFRSRELGPKAVIDMRRSRARTSLADMLRTRGL